MAFRTARALSRSPSSHGRRSRLAAATEGPFLNVQGRNHVSIIQPTAGGCVCRQGGVSQQALLSTRAAPDAAAISATGASDRKSKEEATPSLAQSTRQGATSNSWHRRPPQRFQSTATAAIEPRPARISYPNFAKGKAGSTSPPGPDTTKASPSAVPAPPPLPPVDMAFLRQVDIDPDVLASLAVQKPTPLRLEDMYRYGTSVDAQQRLRNAQYLHREMPIRIAQRVVDLLTLPHGLSESKPIRQVAEIYCRYLQRFNAMPCPRTSAEEDAFTDMLQAFVLDRSSIPMAVARGVGAWESGQRSGHAVGGEASPEELEALEGRLGDMEDALYRFFTARVGLRLLLEHHVLSSRRPECQALRNVTHLFEAGGRGKARQLELGCIQSDCDLVEETRKVADVVTKQTTEYYGMCPAIEIVDCQQQASGGGDKEASSAPAPGSPDPFTYVTHHLHYMLAELLKNSCRATVQQYLQAEAASDGGGRPRQRGSLFSAAERPKLHPIRVIITKGEEDVTVKVADRGGGIPRSWMDHVWKFGHSHHSDEGESRAEFGTSEGAGGARIRGFGLPLARIYARYFGGELNLKSMEGYGVDAYLHLPRLGNSCENLPLRVRASPGERDSTPGRYHAHQFRGYGTRAASEAAAAATANKRAASAAATAASASRSALVPPLSPLPFRGEAVAQNNRAWQE